MKVLFAYKYLTMGGVEAVLRARLDGLAQADIDAHAWFFHDDGGRPMFRGQEHRIRVGPVEDCLRRARDEGFDLLCAIDSDEVLAGFDGREHRVRLIVECHSAYLANIEYLRRLARHHPAAVFTPSEAQGRRVRERVDDDVVVRVVPNPLCQEFIDRPLACSAPPARPIVAWVGRLDEQKNWQGFLRIAGLLLRRQVDCEAWILGKAVETDGPARLRDRARAEGVLGRLRWLDGLPHRRMPAFFDAVRESGGLVASTSRGESFGLTVVEAMARRCPVLAPDEGPFTEFVEDGVTGALVEPDAAERAAERIAALLSDHERRSAMGVKAREAVLARFAPEPALTVLVAELARVAERWAR